MNVEMLSLCYTFNNEICAVITKINPPTPAEENITPNYPLIYLTIRQLILIVCEQIRWSTRHSQVNLNTANLTDNVGKLSNCFSTNQLVWKKYYFKETNSSLDRTFFAI